MRVFYPVFQAAELAAGWRYTANGLGSARQWRPCTPAMAAGLTNYVWSLREVLLFRVPPWPQPQAR
jgi:hypothetical protein